jgi:hypothetical protein
MSNVPLNPGPGYALLCSCTLPATRHSSVLSLLVFEVRFHSFMVRVLLRVTSAVKVLVALT